MFVPYTQGIKHKGIFLLELGDIIEGCKRKNIKAQELLYRAYCVKMKKICLRYCNDSEDAKDILQEGFIKVFESIKDLKENGFLETWMVRIFMNTTYEYYRKKKKDNFVDIQEHMEPTDTVFSAEEESTYEALVDHLSSEEIVNIINTIPYPYHMVFKLFYIDGVSHKEIAEMLHLKESNSRIILHRAKLMLKEILQTKMHKMSLG